MQERNKKIVFRSVFAAVILCMCFLVIAVQSLNVGIVLKGDSVMTLEYGSEYEDPGAEAFLFGEQLFAEGYPLNSSRITATGEVDETKLGEYSVCYETAFLIWEATQHRTVNVVDTLCPVIELKEGPDELVMPGETYEEPGFTATDNCDGDLTDKVLRTELDGVVYYAVTDSSGNPAYAHREVPYYDAIPPVITLDGGEEYTIQVGRVYSEPGYSAVDNKDGEITELVQVEGQVDWLIPGEYSVCYRVEDSNGNQAEEIRSVTVKAADWQDTQWPPDKTIYLTFDDGPGPYTLQLLDLLDRYGVKATFFVVDSEYNHLMKEIVRRGHSIGIHSVTHDYGQIYSSPEAFFEDLFSMQQIIFDNTGVVTTLMRFPGGGSNLVSKNSCKGIMSILTCAVRDAGFQYFDWNVDSDDAGGARKASVVRNNVITGIQETGISMVLQHDIHGYSVEATEDILIWALNNGYTFRSVRDSTPGFHHDVLN